MTSLNDFARLSGTIYVEGAWTKSAATTQIDVIDPATEERIGHIADTTDAEIDQAIDIANKVRKEWWRQDSRTRAVTLHDIAARIRRDKGLYALGISMHQTRIAETDRQIDEALGRKRVQDEKRAAYLKTKGR